MQLKSNPVKVQIIDFRTQEVDGYHDQYHRPYRFNLDDDSISDIENRVKELNPQDNTLGVYLADIAREALISNTTDGKVVNVPGGWAAKRLRFTLKVNIFTAFGGVRQHHYCGYSSQHQLQSDGSISDNTVFYLDSVRHKQEMTQRTPHGVAVVTKQTAAYRYLHPEFQFLGNGDDTTSVARECDVLTAICSQILLRGYSQGEFVDLRLKLNAAVQSHSFEELGSRYLADMIAKYRVSSSLIDFGGSEMDTFARAQELTFVPGIGEDKFLRAIAALTNRPASVAFTMGELRHLQPEGFSQTHSVQAARADYLSVSDNSIETQIAVQLAREFPALATLMETDVLDVEVKSPIVSPQGTMLSPLETIMQREIFARLHPQAADIETLKVTCVVEGETIVSLKFFGQEVKNYRFPTFMGGLYSALHVPDVKHLYEMAAALETLLLRVNETLPSESL